MSINILQTNSMNSIHANSTSSTTTQTAKPELSPKLVILYEEALTNDEKATLISVTGINQINEFDDTELKSDLASLLKGCTVLLIDMTNDKYSTWIASQTNYISNNSDIVKSVYKAMSGIKIDSTRARDLKLTYKISSIKKSKSFPTNCSSYQNLVTQLLSDHVSNSLINKSKCKEIIKFVTKLL